MKVELTERQRQLVRTALIEALSKKNWEASVLAVKRDDANILRRALNEKAELEAVVDLFQLDFTKEAE